MVRSPDGRSAGSGTGFLWIRLCREKAEGSRQPGEGWNMKNAEIETVENLRQDKGLFDIRWRVTTLCNYQCDFCIQGTREEHLRQAEGESEQLRKKSVNG